VLPSSRLVDGSAAPHTGGAVEIEEDPGAGAATVLEDEVAVEQDGFDLSEETVVAVEVGPPALHHADVRFGEVVDDLHEPVGRGDEIGVEDGDEFALGGFEAGVECPGLIAVAVGAVNVDDGVAESGVAFDDSARDLDGFVGGVVEDLNFELAGGVVHLATGFDETVDDELLIKDGELDGDQGQFGEVRRRFLRGILLMLVVEIDKLITVDAVEGEHDHYGEIGNQQEGIEAVPAIEMLEGLVAIMGAEVVLEAVGAGQPEGEVAGGVYEDGRGHLQRGWGQVNQVRASSIKVKDDCKGRAHPAGRVAGNGGEFPWPSMVGGSNRPDSVKFGNRRWKGADFVSDATAQEQAKPKGLKTKVRHEMREMVLIAVYLALFFVAFATQKMFLLHQFGGAVFTYGSALVKALVLAKVILIGQIMGLGKRWEHRPLIVSSVSKAFWYTLLVAAFDVLEDVVRSLIHGEGVTAVFQKMGSNSRYELTIMSVTTFCLFIPFFALMETRRVLGEEEFEHLFLRRKG